MTNFRIIKNEELATYCDQISRAIRTARLNQFYPETRSLISTIQAMSPHYHEGFHEKLKVDASSGLPAYSEWALVLADQRIAFNELHKMDTLKNLEAKANAHPDTIFERQLTKFKYYTKLLRLKPVAIGNSSARLREKGSTHTRFLIKLDKLDAENVFIRYSIDLGQKNNVSVNAIDLDGKDVASESEQMQSLVYRFASLNAEYTFQTIDNMEGIDVEKVTRGTIGPFYFPGGKNIPDWLVDFVHTHGMVATFGLEMAANDIVENSSNDPLAEFLMPKESLQNWAQELGLGFRSSDLFRVFRDRKYVVEHSKVDIFRELLMQRKVKALVYGI